MVGGLQLSAENRAEPPLLRLLDKADRSVQSVRIGQSHGRRSLLLCRGTEFFQWRCSAHRRIIRMDMKMDELDSRHLRALFMSGSAAIVDSRLRQAGMRLNGMPAGGLAARSINILFQVCLLPSRLHAPRHRRLTISPSSTSVALIILRAVDLAWRLRDFATNRHA